MAQTKVKDRAWAIKVIAANMVKTNGGMITAAKAKKTLAYYSDAELVESASKIDKGN